MKKYSFILMTVFLLMIISSCRNEEEILESLEEEEKEEVIDMSDYTSWTDATHGNNVDPNYSVVFNQEKVQRIDIKISSSDWTAMQSDLSNITRSSGNGPGATASLSSNPMWVKCSVFYNNKEWYHVGIRYKGNSSLKSAYQSGNKKLSFKLDFDEFEDDFPAIKNQRFYGFKQLNLNNNFDDASLIREKVGADLFRQFGLAAAKTSFYIVYLDNGSGPQYYGVYTLVEEVDDTVLESQFAKSNGNLYKPDGTAASFANGSYNTSQMELKTNKDSANYSDVKALYDAINSTLRTSDAETWKTNLEKVFNVDVFLKWLAANIVIQNWDTYGRMTHNYYLYNNPENGLLTWIPWDNNEAFQTGKQGGALSLSLSEVNSSWPLISYIIAQPEYKQVYQNYLRKFTDEVYVPGTLTNTYSNYYNLLKEHAYAEVSGYTFINSDAAFDAAIQTMKNHVQARNNAVNTFLN